MSVIYDLQIYTTLLFKFEIYSYFSCLSSMYWHIFSFGIKQLKMLHRRNFYVVSRLTDHLQ